MDVKGFDCPSCETAGHMTDSFRLLADPEGWQVECLEGHRVDPVPGLVVVVRDAETYANEQRPVVRRTAPIGEPVDLGQVVQRDGEQR